MNTHNHHWQLMARHLSGETSAEEESDLQQLLANQPALANELAILKTYWQSAANHPSASQQEQALKQLLGKLPIAENRKSLVSLNVGRKSWLAIAATTVVLLGLALIGYRFLNNHSAVNNKVAQTVLPQQMRTEAGSRLRRQLPDGSVVWLNAGSELRYDSLHFTSAEKRLVTLVGEAFFEVVKNPQKPFVVRAGALNVEVLGTSFNVEAYAGDAVATTTLVSGKVKLFYDQQQAKAITLLPHQKISLPLAIATPQMLAQKLRLAQVEMMNEDQLQDQLSETAWLYNRLVFDNETLATLAPKLERWYNVQILLKDRAVSQLTFSGSFETETLEQALQAMQQASPFAFGINGQQVTIQSKSR